MADARNRFSELVSKALTDGPQRVTRRNDVVVVLSEDDYLRLRGEQTSLVEYIMSGADLGELDLTRDRSPIQPVH